MKKIFIFLLASLMTFSSCTMYTKVGKDEKDEKDEKESKIVGFNYEGMRFDANEGFIPTLLAENPKSKILSRTTKISEGEQGKDLITDSFEIEKGGTFYYPILANSLHEALIPTSVNQSYEYVIGALYPPNDSDSYNSQLEVILSALKDFDFKEIPIGADTKLTVFEFINKVSADDLEGEAPVMSVRLLNKYKDSIYSYGFEGGTFTESYFILDAFIQNENMEGRPDFLVCTGDYPDEFDVSAYANGSLEHKIEGLDVEVVKREMGAHELALELFELLEVKGGTFELGDDDKKLQVLDNFLKFLAGELLDIKVWDKRLDEVIYTDMRHPRIIYLKFDLKDGDTLTLEKPVFPSYNYHCGSRGLENDLSGYYFMPSADFSTELTIEKNMDIVAVLVDSKQVYESKGENPRKAWKVPAGSDLELMFLN